MMHDMSSLARADWMGTEKGCVEQRGAVGKGRLRGRYELESVGAQGLAEQSEVGHG